MAVLRVFRVESCVWLCRGFSGTKCNTIDWFGTKCNTKVYPIWALTLGMVPKTVLMFGSATILTLSLGPVPNVILYSGLSNDL